MAKLDLSQVVGAINSKAPNLLQVTSNAFQDIEDGVNNLAQQVAADPVGLSQAPAPLQSVNVKVSGETVHVTLTHNVPVNKNIRYFVEYTQNDPAFLQPHVEHLGTSRGRVLNLPTNDDSSTKVNYYFRAYPQYPGSHPAQAINFGGATPTAVTLGGSTNLTLQPSTGSGTAAANGQQGNYGFGKTNRRPSIGPKRAIPA